MPAGPPGRNKYGFFDGKYKKLGIDNAPGQEALQKTAALDLRGEKLPGLPVDFSHGDVDAFPPLPGSREAFDTGFALGGETGIH